MFTQSVIKVSFFIKIDFKIQIALKDSAKHLINITFMYTLATVVDA
jgi:hypothetical protein